MDERILEFIGDLRRAGVALHQLADVGLVDLLGHPEAAAGVFAAQEFVLTDGGTQRLPRIVGLPQALRWGLSGKLFDSAEAHG